MLRVRVRITKYYSQADNYSQVLIEITEALINMKNHSNLYACDLLIDRLKKVPFILKSIDTSWMHNVNSKT